MAKSVEMNIFCKNVRTALEARGMTLTSLAEATGIHRPNLSKILSGKEGVTLDRAGVISSALGYPLSDLVSSNFKILKQSA